MTTATFMYDGEAIDYTPTADVAAGAVVVQGELVGVAKSPIPANVAKSPIPANKLGALAVAGVFDLPKATGAGTAITAGAEVFWDEAEQVAKTDSESGANKKLGKTVASAGDDDTTVRVRLSQ